MSAYRITEVGFEKAEAVFFRTTIEMASEFDIAAWVCVGDRDADVILVNADKEKYASGFTLDGPTQNNIRPILIGCSCSGEKCDSFSHTLKKPLTYSKITTLLLKLEQELTPVRHTSPLLTEEHGELKNEHHTSTSLKQEISSEAGLQPEIHAISTSHPIGENQDQNDLLNGIDEDSEYDILAMDSEFDSFQPGITPTSDTNSHRTSTDQSKTSGKNGNISSSSEMIRPTRWFLEETRFLGLIRKPVFLAHPTEITHYIYPPVRIYPDQQIFASKSYLGLSQDFFRSRTSGFSIHELMKPDQKEPSESWNSWPLWLLFYLAALYGSEGRLKENTSPHDRLRLTSKPDFDVVPNHTDYRTIADYMMTNESQDLNTIADGSGVNIKTVIDFCNACEEIDIIDRTPSNHSEIILPTKTSQNRKGESSVADRYAAANQRLIKRFKSIFNNTG